MTPPTQQPPGPPPPPPFLYRCLARLILRLATLSRLWPVRAITRSRLRRWGAHDFSATTPDGLRIQALYLPAQQPPSLTPPPQSTRQHSEKPPVVLVHGWLETKEFHTHPARLLQTQGHDVFLLDLPAHGRSTGLVTTFGLSESHALTSVINEATSRGWMNSRVMTYGFSLGAATALQHAAQDPRVAAVVAVAPFWNFQRAVESFHATLAPFLDLARLTTAVDHAARKHNFTIQQPDAARAVASLSIPLLIVTGDHDRLLPAHLHAIPLSQLDRPTPNSSRLLLIPGAGHTTLCWRPWPTLDHAVLTLLNSLTPTPIDKPTNV